MKKLAFLALLSTFLALPAFGQSSTQGQVTISVAGFSQIPEGTSQCQPGPSSLFQPCALPTPSLGVPYSFTLTTVGIKAPVTCSVASGGSMPAWMTLTASGTSCVLSGTPMTTTALTGFTVDASGS